MIWHNNGANDGLSFKIVNGNGTFFHEAYEESADALTAKLNWYEAEIARLQKLNEQLAERVAICSELLGKRATKPPTWSKEPPAAEGSYWWRDGSSKARIVQVRLVAEGSPRLYALGFLNEVKAMGGEWLSVQLPGPQNERAEEPS